MRERNYSKTSRTCCISNRQFPRTFFRSTLFNYVLLLRTLKSIMNVLVKKNSTVDSNNQILSKPRDSNRAPPIESNIKSSIISDNGATTPTSHSNVIPTLTQEILMTKVMLVTWVILDQFCADQRESSAIP